MNYVSWKIFSFSWNVDRHLRFLRASTRCWSYPVDNHRPTSAGDQRFCFRADRDFHTNLKPNHKLTMLRLSNLVSVDYKRHKNYFPLRLHRNNLLLSRIDEDWIADRLISAVWQSLSFHKFSRPQKLKQNLTYVIPYFENSLCRAQMSKTFYFYEAT